MNHTLRELLKIDISSNLRGVKGGRLARLNAFLRSPGIQAIVAFRFGHWIVDRGMLVKLFLQPLYIYLNHRVRMRWGIEIHRQATIGPGLRLVHYGGIFIGGKVVIGKNCLIAHDVTIGLSERAFRTGSPTIGDDVTIGPGVKIIGPITVGNNVRIGPNSLVTKDVPDNARVALESTRSVIFPESKTED